ncbi:MAG: alpha/beta hydrolase [Rhodospirillales bacterium]
MIGDAERPPLVFLHGAFTAAWVWKEYFLPWFAERGHTVFAPSYRGHGQSDGPEDLHELGINDYVQDILSVIAGLDSPPILIGHSMGGYVALKAAMKRKVRGLVLMSSVPPTGLGGPALTMALFQPSLLWRLTEVQDKGTHMMTLEAVRDALFSGNISRSLLATYMHKAQMESRRATLELYAPATLNPLSLPRVPTMVIGGDMDRLIAPLYVTQTAGMMGTLPHFYHGMGHGLMLEKNWETVAEDILAFVERI